MENETKKALHVFIYLMLTAFKFPDILSPRSYTRDILETILCEQIIVGQKF